MTTSAIVLCGGRSSRMGRDKATLSFGDETLLARVVRTAQMVVDDVVVVGESDAVWPDGVQVVRDPVDGLGPLAGLVTGLIGRHAAIARCCWRATCRFWSRRCCGASSSRPAMRRRACRWSTACR